MKINSDVFYLFCMLGLLSFAASADKNKTYVIAVLDHPKIFSPLQPALEAGADTVLPKPMGRAHLLKLLLAALPKPNERAGRVSLHT